MGEQECTANLHQYLQNAREAILCKLDGLSEYDVRRPLVPTGTNLLGLVKHLAGVEFGYFGATFGRPSPDEPPVDEADADSGMFARPEESRVAGPPPPRRAGGQGGGPAGGVDGGAAEARRHGHPGRLRRRLAPAVRGPGGAHPRRAGGPGGAA
ncbi:MAG TPA: DUF664 domain-containing protein [Trebonia sp.]|nr:DUF664 domain-containing protein [Trebonia sp.]